MRKNIQKIRLAKFLVIIMTSMVFMEGAMAGVYAKDTVYTKLLEVGEDEEESIVSRVYNRGDCGSNLHWEIRGSEGDLTLEITGSGEMYDYPRNGSMAPWEPYLQDIKEIRLSSKLTRIGNDAFSFSDSSIEPVEVALKLPGNLRSIGARAFSGLKIESLIFPESLTSLDEYTFEGNHNIESITVDSNNEWFMDNGKALLDSSKHKLIYAFPTIDGSFDLPETVAEISPFAFQNCTMLTSVTLRPAMSTIGEYAFDGCTMLRTVTFQENHPDQKTKSMEKIERGAFRNTGIREFVMPENMTYVADEAFSGCSSLESFDAAGDAILSIGESAFSGCSALTSVSMSDALRTISDNAFEDCISISQLSIPSHLKTLGHGVFNKCSTLERIEFSEPSNNSVSSPDTVSPPSVSDPSATVSPGSVEGAGIIESPVIDPIADFDTTPDIGLVSSEPVGASSPSDDSLIFENGAVLNKDKTKLFSCISTASGDGSGVYKIPATVKEIYPYCFSYTEELTRVVIPDSIEVIPDHAFYYSSITSVEIPDSVKLIDDYAFYGADLESLELPVGVEEIGDSAFQNLSHWIGSGIYLPHSLDSLSLPDGLLKIGDNAFDVNLTELEIPDSVEELCLSSINSTARGGMDLKLPLSLEKINTKESIDTYYKIKSFSIGSGNYDFVTQDGVLFSSDMSTLYAFPADSQIEEYSIPEEVTTISDYAFASNQNLMALSIPNSVTKIGRYAFMKCNALSDVTLPSALKEIPEYCFFACPALNSISLPSGLTEIGDYAFAECASLPRVTLSSNVARLGKGSFMECISLSEADIESEKLTLIPESAFYGCSYLESFTVPKGITALSKNSLANCSSMQVLRLPDTVKNFDFAAFNGDDGIQMLYYEGSQEDYELISIDYHNEPLFHVAWHYDSTTPDVNHHIIAEAQDANGRIVPSGNLVITHNDTPSFRIIPNEGYQIAYVSVDGISVVPPSANYVFDPVVRDHTITCAFRAKRDTSSDADPADKNPSPPTEIPPKEDPPTEDPPLDDPNPPSPSHNTTPWADPDPPIVNPSPSANKYEPKDESDPKPAPEEPETPKEDTSDKDKTSDKEKDNDTKSPSNNSASGNSTSGNSASSNTASGNGAVDPYKNYTKYTVSVSGVRYEVFYTPTVSYDGRPHVNVSSKKSSKKYNKDMNILVSADGIDMYNYKVKFHNNKNVYYGTDAKRRPYFSLVFPKAEGELAKSTFKNMKFFFEIEPADISSGKNIRHGRIKAKNGNIVINGLKYVNSSTGKKIRMKQNRRNSRGDYRIFAVSQNGVTIQGLNNYSGNLTIKR